jgi:CHAT domain-containing protein/tetratricopeptide (TPR) repeat protein
MARKILCLLLGGWMAIACLYAQTGDSLHLESLYQEAFEREKAARYEEALPLYRDLRQQSLPLEEWNLYARAWYKIGLNLSRAGQYQAAIDTLQTAIEKAGKNLPVHHRLISGMHNEIGTANWYLSDLASAEKAYRQSLELSLASPDLDANRIRSARSNIALVLFGQGFHREAIAAFQEILTQIDPQNLDDTLAQANIQVNIGTAYTRLGDYARGLDYNQLGLQGHIYVFGPDHPQIGNDLTNIGHVLEELKRYEEALEHHQRALQLQQKSLGPSHPTVGNTYLNLGATYEGLNDLAAAEENYEKALDIYLQKLAPTDPDLFLVLNNLCGVAYNQGDLLRTERFARYALRQAQKYQLVYPPIMARIYKNMARVYEMRDEIDSVRHYYQLAIFNIRATAESKRLGEVLFKPELLEVYSAYANWATRHALNHPQTGDFEEVFQLVDSSLAVINSTRLENVDAQSRQALLSYGSNLLDNGLRASYGLFALHQDEKSLAKGFHYANSSQATALFENLRTNEALQYAGVPPAVLRLENRLQTQLGTLQEQLYYLEEEEDNANTENLQLRSKIAETQLRYDSLMQAIERQYPAYFQLWHQISLPSPTEIQKALPPHTALLNYKLTKNNLFCWLIGPEGVQWQALDTGLLDQLHRFRDLLQNPATPLEKYRSQAHALYQSLLQKTVEGLSGEVKNLIIVPDGVLGTIPFEVLCQDETGASYADLSYLLRRYAISYAYSASVLLEQLAREEKGAAEVFGGFAADYSAADLGAGKDSSLFGELLRSGELPLPGARREVLAIEELLGGRTFLETQASEEKFKAEANRFSIIHLAMHTLLDDRNPLYSQLIFSPGVDSLEDGLLKVSELYNLNLSAQLAVLSACNTGYGRILEGEGVISLSRAFAYAGCPSTVVSLWKVPDQATSLLMPFFYENLTEKWSKSTALQQAKLSYLAQAKDAQLAHPFHWAGFIQAGNPAPLPLGGGSNLAYWLAGLILLLVSGWLVYRFRKN